MTKYLIFLFSVILPLLVYPANKLKHYSINNGLSQSVVNCIYQDSKGFLWIGTQDGLNKFDGYTFTKYIQIPVDTNSISNNWIFSIDEDADGNILVGTKAGLQKYLPGSNQFTHITNNKENDNSIYDDFVYGVVADSNYIWANTPPVLNRIDKNTGDIQRFSYYNPTIIGSKKTTVSDQSFPLFIDSKDNIWISSEYGVFKFNSITGEIFDVIKSCDGLANVDPYVTSITEDNENNIWIGSRSGLIIYRSISNECLLFDNENSEFSRSFIRSLITDKNGYIWVGTDGDGLYKTRFNSKKGTLNIASIYKSGENKEHSLSHDIVYSLFIDRSDILWIGTLQGLDKLDMKEKKFRLYQKSNQAGSINLLENVIASIYKEENTIWVGNWGKGLNIYNRNTNEVKHYSKQKSGKQKISNDFVHVIFKDINKNLWIGTRNGIDVYDKEKDRFIPVQDFYKEIKFPDFSSNRIYSILLDSENKYWIGTQKRLYIIDIEKADYTSVSNNTKDLSISDNLVYQIIEDNDQDIWIGTTNGLDYYNRVTHTITHYKSDPGNSNSLCDNFVVSLCADANGNIWIGTKSGVSKLYKKAMAFDYYSEKDNLPSNMVYEIIEDNQKNIWFSTGRGLAKLDNSTGKIRTYDVEDGLQSMEFNINAIFRANDGEMFFGGMNGFNSFYPDSLNDNEYIPQVVITNIEYHNQQGLQSINPYQSKELNFNHKDYAFQIEFAALEYTNPSQNMYAYKMEGITNDWVQLGNRNFVTFSDIPPGLYKFIIKGSNSDAKWNDKGTSITFYVKPPWWRTKLAYVAYLFLIVSTIIIVIRIRERKLRTERQILEQKVKERTVEIAEKNEILTHQKEEILAQNDEIKAQRDMATDQRDQIAEQNKAITDSIQYAKRIQAAMMPRDEWLDENLPEYFILYNPRDIVSGDFYWVKRVDHYIIIAIADCTGHGVPGAMVSMLGAAILNEIIRRKEVTTASQVLNFLRNEVKVSLNQTGRHDEQKDGMDIALCVIDEKEKVLQFSGANCPLYLIRNGEIVLIKGDKMPIGVHYMEKSFTNHKIKLEKNDIIYLFTDGYIDQFGGESGRKLLAKNFRKIIIENSGKSLLSQKEVLINELDKWRGDHQQIDDITVFALKYMN